MFSNEVTYAFLPDIDEPKAPDNVKLVSFVMEAMVNLSDIPSIYKIDLRLPDVDDN